jgi:hypothetical protein
MEKHLNVQRSTSNFEVIMDVGCWMLDVGCWMLDVGCWMLDVERSYFKFRSEHPTLNEEISVCRRWLF